MSEDASAHQAAPSLDDPAPAPPGTMSLVDRAAALATPPPRVPRQVFYWAAGVIAVLGVGGAFLEHFLDAHGIPAYSISASSTSPPTASSAGSTPSSGAVRASLPRFMDIARLPGGPAPAFRLTDQTGATVSLTTLRGRVVVLTFFGTACKDICPVLGREIARADAELAGASAHVAFVAVNTDPLATSRAAVERTTGELGLGSLANWYFLTGTIARLDPVWTRYGITIEVSTTTHRIAHTDVVYFLDPAGRERLRATPFADQSRSGQVSLPASSIERFAGGIASYARGLLPYQERR